MTESGVTAGGEISVIWRQEEVELSSTSNVQRHCIVTDTSSFAKIIESNINTVIDYRL